VKTIDNRSLFSAITHDGIFLLIFTGIILILSGVFVIVQSYTGKFLPHDVDYLGMNADQLALYNPKIVKFMFHDRVSFGGTLITLGLLYTWLAEFPLRNKEPWAWYVLLMSGMMGFANFMTYLGYGYLDTYHAGGTIALFPFYIGGMWYSRRSFINQKIPLDFKSLLESKTKRSLRSSYGIGYIILYFISAGVFLGGIVIMILGSSIVFVPQDLGFMCMNPEELSRISAKLIPLIAHDRAGFGGVLVSTGLVLLFIIHCATPSKSLWQILFLSLSIGFFTAIGIHFFIGYISFSHLLPAYTGAFIFYIGIVLSFNGMYKNRLLC
jgi:hypothetical protein